MMRLDESGYLPHSIRAASDLAFSDPRWSACWAFDPVVANPMSNQNWFTEADYDSDELDRVPAGAGFPGKSSADRPMTAPTKKRPSASGSSTTT